MRINGFCDVICLLLPFCFFTVLLPDAYAFTGYKYSDNVRDFMASGMRNLEKGYLSEAEIDFENVILISPGHKEARKGLLNVYIRQGKKFLAEKVFRGMKADNVFTRKELESFADRVKAMPPGGPKKAPAIKHRMTLLPIPSGLLPQPITVSGDAGGGSGSASGGGSGSASGGGSGGASGGGSGSASGGGSGSASGGGSGSASGGGSGSASGGGSGSASGGGSGGAFGGGALSTVDYRKMSADEKFKKAIELRRSNRINRAISLFVAAIQENPGLLARDDEGLLAISRRTYTRHMNESPDNPNFHFIVAYFDEIFSEYEKARQQYSQVMKLTSKDSKLYRAAQSKVENLAITIASNKEARERARKKAEEEAEKTRLNLIRLGKAPGLIKASDYAKRGEDFYADWSKSKNGKFLDEAEAYMDGAIALDENNASLYYTQALILVEQDVLGRKRVKPKAKRLLRRALTLSPPAELKSKIEKLLKDLSPSRRAVRRPRRRRRSKKDKK